MNDTKVYCRPIRHLKGKTALTRESASPEFRMAQFDDATLTLSGLPFADVIAGIAPRGEPPADCLGFGWHGFPADHFKERE